MATLNTPKSITFRTVLHDNPKEFYRISLQAFDAALNPGSLCGGDQSAIACTTFATPRTLGTCAETGGTVKDSGMTCVWQDTLVLDPALIGYSGWQQFRFRTHLQGGPDSRKMLSTTGLNAYVDNGRPRKDVYQIKGTYDVIETRGWYEGPAYAVANLLRPPLSSVSGLWLPDVNLEKGADGSFPVTSHYAALDTDFHNGNPGIPLAQGTGELHKALWVDTTALDNGWHRIFLKTDAFDSTSGSTNSGVLSMNFLVDNGVGPMPAYLPAVADAHVRGGTYAAQNYGTKSLLEVKNGSGTTYDRETYLRFDLSSLPSTTSSATLSLYVAALPNGTPVTLRLYGVQADTWGETSLTWNNRPASSGALVASKVASAPGWITFDVTSFVAAELAGNKLVSMVLRDDAAVNRMVEIRSKEAVSGYPHLAVVP